jgi:hypothetical protein
MPWIRKMQFSQLIFCRFFGGYHIYIKILDIPMKMQEGVSKVRLNANNSISIVYELLLSYWGFVIKVRDPTGKQVDSIILSFQHRPLHLPIFCFILLSNRCLPGNNICTLFNILPTNLSKESISIP